jgi:glycosyltransferase involved in cell wall biosynthesis
MLLRLAESMRDLGVDSSVVSLGSSQGVAKLSSQGVAKLFEESGMRVSALNIAPTTTGAIVGVQRLRRVVNSVRPDIVQGWMYHANIIATLALNACRCAPKTMWNIRRGLDDYAQRRLKTRLVIRGNAALSSLADGIIYCSAESQTQHEQIGFDRRRSVVLVNGFDVGRFKPDPERRSEFRRAHGVEDEQVIIGNVGRFDIAKGHSFLVEAFSRVLELRPNARLVLAGRGVDYSNSLLVSLLHTHGCFDQAILLGEQSAVENLLPAFDIYCSSSISEGFPNALSEALACGVACVATDTGASKQLVEGVGGLVPSRHPSLLADALVAMIDEGAQSRVEKGSRGRQRIATKYALASVAKRYHDLYQQTLGLGEFKRAA